MEIGWVRVMSRASCVHHRFCMVCLGHEHYNLMNECVAHLDVSCCFVYSLELENWRMGLASSLFHLPYHMARSLVTPSLVFYPHVTSNLLAYSLLFYWNVATVSGPIQSNLKCKQAPPQWWMNCAVNWDTERNKEEEWRYKCHRFSMLT